jgi:hypothetical protein
MDLWHAAQEFSESRPLVVSAANGAGTMPASSPHVHRRAVHFLSHPPNIQLALASHRPCISYAPASEAPQVIRLGVEHAGHTWRYSKLNM